MPFAPAPTPPGARPTARHGDDACPGALRLHPAADGALARIRIPAGLLTARQATALAHLAVELGDGCLDLTSRGNVQVRGLAPDRGAALAVRLRMAGLLPSDRHERVRNIAASPLAGLDEAGHADVQGWARELDALLCADPDAARLSGRFLFGLDDGRGDVAALAPDVTLIAGQGGRATLGYGTAGPALGLAAEDAPRAAVLAARGFLSARDGSGTDAWRVADLPQDQRPRADALAARLADAGIGSTPLPRTAPPLGAPPAPGLVPGPHGAYALSVAAPLGRMTVAQWELLIETATRDGNGELRVTPWRGIVLPGLGAAAAPARLAALADAGFVTSEASPWHGAGACAGRPGCAKSLADVRADAAAALSGRSGGGLPVYWSGCERRCGHPGGDWVDVLATGDGYRIAVQPVPDGVPIGSDGPAEPVAPGRPLADAVAAARRA
ncbi:precorrin-3B synthase [Streptomyces sp. NPDC050617]|uniref:precorrin-3B synthase n=1 Tax=Streptomyces sp. NPDC050617 TaxID=3154628 RepID=UPI00343E1374